MNVFDTTLPEMVAHAKAEFVSIFKDQSPSVLVMDGHSIQGFRLPYTGEADPERPYVYHMTIEGTQRLDSWRVRAQKDADPSYLSGSEIGYGFADVNGSPAYIMYAIVGADRSLVGVTVASKETIATLSRPSPRTKQPAELGPGVFSANYHPFSGLQFHTQNIPTTTAVHPMCTTVTDTIQNHLADPSKYLRSGRDGTLRVLLFGPPGTGKSTLLYNVARSCAADTAVVYGSLGIVSNVAQHAVDRGLKLLYICEDEKLVNNPGLLQYLDGASAVRNENGAVVVFTTNYAADIPRPIRRPGRIHRPIYIGPVSGQDAADVIQHYLPNAVWAAFADYTQEIVGAGMTGAEIEAACLLAEDIAFDEENDVPTIEQFSAAVEHIQSDADAFKNATRRCDETDD